MSTEENKAVVRRFLEQALSTNNLEIADEVFAPNYVNHGLSATDPPADREASKQLAAQLFCAFPDMQVTVEDIVAEGDTVIARYRVRGTHRGELNGIPPAGKQVDVQGVACYRLANGKIVDDWPGLDMLGLLTQIGAVAA